MITKKTGFIIGAGASVPYGMPTGAELRQFITRSPQDTLTSLNRFIVVNRNKYLSFAERFKNSNIASIDKFLNLNPEFEMEGKLAITYYIKQYENLSVQKITDKDWIPFLYNKMIEDIDSYDDAYDIYKNNINFCTFNYDRILEYSLNNFFYHSFAQNNAVDGTKNIIRDSSTSISSSNLQVEHVYGKIGDFFTYPLIAGVDEIKNYYNDIKLINERKRDVSHIINTLSDCERIFLLGYGFNKENNQLLDLKNIFKGKKVYATGVGLFKEERLNIGMELACEVTEDNCYEILRKYL